MAAYGAFRNQKVRCVLSNDTPINSNAESNGAEAEDAAKGKGLGLIPMIGAAVVAAGVAGGAAFVLTPGAQEDSPACTETADHGEQAASQECAEETSAEKKKEKKKASNSHGGGHGDEIVKNDIEPIGEIQHTDYTTFLALDPMVIAISPLGRSKYLKISLVLETDDAGAEEILNHGYYVKDVLNTFLRSVDSAVLEDPAAMSRLRAQILRRVRAIVPDADIQNVLITEFILT